MASYDETLDPNEAPRPRPVPKPKPVQTTAPRRRPAQPPGMAETVSPNRPTQRQHARDEAAIAHPRQFGTYRIRPNGILGQGGMGVVYTAEQAHPRRLVALKVIRPMLGTREMVKRFRLEAEVLGRLEHPGIARIYDAGSADAGAGPQPYFAMELVKGQPLLDYVNSHQLTLHDKLELIARICDAVHYAHECGVVHRDLKPSNILVEASGQPKILDFGVARVTDSDVQNATMQTDSGSLVGTVQYMSPEQAAGRHKAIDAQSDVYALGLMAYEILGGRYPFDLGNVALFEALRIVREQDVPPLAMQDRTLRGDVETIVHKALEKEKPRRYATAADLAADIRRHLTHRPISARPPSVGYIASRYLRRNRVLVGSVAAAMLVIALGIAWLTTGQSASSARQVNDLNRRFNQQLAGANWSAETMNELAEIESELSARSPADAAAAAARLQKNLAQHIRDSIYKPRLDNISQIEQRLGLLTTRDAAAAAGLRRELQSRTSGLQPVLSLGVGEPVGATPATAERFARADGEKVWTFAAPKGYRAGNAVVPLGVSCGANTRAELTVGADWEALPAQVGFSFLRTAEKPSSDDATNPLSPVSNEKQTVEDRAVEGYTLQFDVEYLDESGQVPTGALRTLAEARRMEGKVVLTIRRGARVLRETKWDAKYVPPGPLTLVATRNGGELSLVVNGLPPIEAMDAFPALLIGSGVAVKLADQAPVERLAVLRRPLPQTPHTLDIADERFAAGAFNEAAIHYESVASGDPDAQVRLEARFKLGVSLARQARGDEAVAVLDALMQEPQSRWSAAAGCTLWLIHLENDRRAQAQSVLDLLSARFPMQTLVEVLPNDMRRTLQGIYINEFNSLNLLRVPDPANVERLRQASSLDQLMDPEITLQFLCHAYEAQGNFDAAAAVAERMIGQINMYSWRGPMAIQSYSTLMRMRGEPQKALDAVHRVLMDKHGVARPQFWSLMIERARLLESMGDFEQAERDLVTFLKHRQDRTSYAHLADASLLLGFLRERRGDHAGAVEAWRGGLYRTHLERSKSFSAANRRAAQALATNDLQSALVLGCLANDITDEEIDELGLLGQFSNNEGFDFLRRGGYRVPASTVRATFADPRGRQWAHTFALRADPQPQLLRTLVTHMLREFFCESAIGSDPTAAQDAMMSRAAEGLGRMYTDRKIAPPQMLQLALAWRGTTGILGWAGLHATLDPDVRGPLGHVIAHHYQRIGFADEAAKLRAQAEADMAAHPLIVSTTAPATTAPTITHSIAKASVKVDVADVRPPGFRPLAKAPAPPPAAASPSPATRPVEVAQAETKPSDPPSAPAAAPSPAPAPTAAPASLYEQLKETNAQAFRFRRDGKMAEAAALRHGVVEKAKAAWPASDERVVSFTLDYVEVLLELSRYDEADALLATAQASGVTGPAAQRLASVAVRAHRARGNAPAAAPAATQPAAPAASVASAPIAPAPAPATAPAGLSRTIQAPPALAAELNFVTDAINSRDYREAEIRLLELYGNAMADAPDAARQRAIQLALARVYDAWGKPADAKRFRQREAALATAAAADGRPDPRKLEWLDAMNRQAFALRQQERLNLAEVLRKRVVTEAKQLLPPGDAQRIAFQIDYVDLLLQMARYEDAERELLDTRTTAADKLSSADAGRIERALLRVYDKWGKPERARSLQIGSPSSPTSRPTLTSSAAAN